MDTTCVVATQNTLSYDVDLLRTYENILLTLQSNVSGHEKHRVAFSVFYLTLIRSLQSFDFETSLINALLEYLAYIISIEQLVYCQTVSEHDPVHKKRKVSNISEFLYRSNDFEHDKDFFNAVAIALLTDNIETLLKSYKDERIVWLKCLLGSSIEQLNDENDNQAKFKTFKTDETLINQPCPKSLHNATLIHQLITNNNENTSEVDCVIQKYDESHYQNLFVNKSNYFSWFKRTHCLKNCTSVIKNNSNKLTNEEIFVYALFCGDAKECISRLASFNYKFAKENTSILIQTVLICFLNSNELVAKSEFFCINDKITSSIIRAFTQRFLPRLEAIGIILESFCLLDLNFETITNVFKTISNAQQQFHCKTSQIFSAVKSVLESLQTRTNLSYHEYSDILCSACDTLKFFYTIKQICNTVSIRDSCHHKLSLLNSALSDFINDRKKPNQSLINIYQDTLVNCIKQFTVTYSNDAAQWKLVGLLNQAFTILIDTNRVACIEFIVDQQLHAFKLQDLNDTAIFLRAPILSNISIDKAILATLLSKAVKLLKQHRPNLVSLFQAFVEKYCCKVHDLSMYSSDDESVRIDFEQLIRTYLIVHFACSIIMAYLNNYKNSYINSKLLFDVAMEFASSSVIVYLIRVFVFQKLVFKELSPDKHLEDHLWGISFRKNDLDNDPSLIDASKNTLTREYCAVLVPFNIIIRGISSSVIERVSINVYFTKDDLSDLFTVLLQRAKISDVTILKPFNELMDICRDDSFVQFNVNDFSTLYSGFYSQLKDKSLTKHLSDILAHIIQSFMVIKLITYCDYIVLCLRNNCLNAKQTEKYESAQQLFTLMHKDFAYVKRFIDKQALCYNGSEKKSKNE